MDRPPLPTGYQWGEQSGDYVTVLRDGRAICKFGGVQCKVAPKSEWPGILAYCIAKGEHELARSS